jgi:hypothetical protein
MNPLRGKGELKLRSQQISTELSQFVKAIAGDDT